MSGYLQSNTKFYIRDFLPSTTGVAGTFRISPELELGEEIETGGLSTFVVLKNRKQIERFLLTITGGVATIVKRGLEQDGTTENTDLQKPWGDGTLGYITAKPDDFPAIGFLSTTGGTMTGILNQAYSSSLVALATTDLSTATGDTILITGIASISSLGTLPAGSKKTLVFASTPTLVYNATSMILFTNANIPVAAGDVADFVSEGSGNWRLTNYERRDGTPLTALVQAIENLTKSFTIDENMTVGDLGYITSTGVSKWIGEVGATASFTPTTSQIAALSSSTGVAISSTGTAYNITAFTRSGLTLTVGSNTLLKTMTPNTAIYAVIAINSTTFVAFYGENHASFTPTLYARAGTVSGTTITLGSEVTIDSGTSRLFSQNAMCKADTDRFAVAWIGTGSTRQLACGSVTGTTIAMGTPITNNTGTGNWRMSYVAAGKIFMMAENGGGTIDVASIATFAGLVPTNNTSASLPGSGGYTTVNTYACSLGNNLVAICGLKAGVNSTWIATCSGTSASYSALVTQTVGNPVGIKINDSTSGLYYSVLTASSGVLNYYVASAVPQFSNTQTIFTSPSHNLTEQMTNGIFVTCISGTGLTVVNANKASIIGSIASTGTASQSKLFNLLGSIINANSTLTARLPVYVGSTGALGHSGSLKIGAAISSTQAIANSSFVS